MEASTEPYALGPAEGRPIGLGEGFVVAVKADEERTGGVVSVLETEEPPGFGPPPHVRHDCAEAFYVLEGEYVMSDALRRQDVPDDELAGIAARHAMEIVGPPSERYV